MMSSSPAEYKEALGILANSSQHIELIAQAIKQKILPRLTKRNSLLDVGAGIGILTQRLESEFNEITVLDINPEVEKDLRSHSHYDVKICDFFTFETDKKYDFVLCSHVMYHFDEAQMKTFIDKMQSLVNPGGCCFIALIAPRGKNHLFHIKFNANYVNSNQIINVLLRDNVSFDRLEAAAPHHLQTKTECEMRSLLKFFLIENCLRKRSSAIQPDEHLQMNLILDEVVKGSQVASEEFDFEQEDDYFVIPRLR
jgi:2-polyprenyl-3-methyl-5-hydroxy-6-metoxy-1,4-benzoquinol methylase